MTDDMFEHIQMSARTTRTTNMLITPSYEIPIAGSTIYIQNTYTVLNPAATLATLTIALPVAPKNGFVLNITSTKDITALTITYGDVVGAPTTLVANTPLHLIYIEATSKWFIC